MPRTLSTLPVHTGQFSMRWFSLKANGPCDWVDVARMTAAVKGQVDDADETFHMIGREDEIEDGFVKNPFDRRFLFGNEGARHSDIVSVSVEGEREDDDWW